LDGISPKPKSLPLEAIQSLLNVVKLIIKKRKMKKEEEEWNRCVLKGCMHGPKATHHMHVGVGESRSRGP
jgi:hypothetical protein